MIISEAGIAKGVRRIIAFAGDLVKTAYSNTDDIRVKIANAKTKQGEELAKEIASLTTVLASTTIPAILRPVFEKEIDDLVVSKLAGKKGAAQNALSQAEAIVAKVTAEKITVCRGVVRPVRRSKGAQRGPESDQGESTGGRGDAL